MKVHSIGSRYPAPWASRRGSRWSWVEENAGRRASPQEARKVIGEQACRDRHEDRDQHETDSAVIHSQVRGRFPTEGRGPTGGDS